MLFLNSGFPVFHAGQDELIGRMKEWNAYCAVHKFDIKAHPFWLFHPWLNQTVEYIDAFLKSIFQSK